LAGELTNDVERAFRTAGKGARLIGMEPFLPGERSTRAKIIDVVVESELDPAVRLEIVGSIRMVREDLG